MTSNLHKTYVFLLLAVALWGVQPVVVKAVLKELSPIFITSCRYFIISAVLFGILILKRDQTILPSKKQLAVLAAMGAFGVALNNVSQFSGLQYSSVLNCSLISAVTPALTAVLTVLYLKERLDAFQWLGITLSACGVLYLVAHGSAATILSISFNHGDILFFTSQFGWAVYVALGRKIMKEISPLAATAWAGLSGAVITAVYGVFEGGFGLPDTLSLSGLYSMFYITIGGGVLAMTWWNKGVKAIGAGQAAIFSNLVPIIGIATAVLVAGEHVGWRELFGAMWIIAGVYITSHSQQCQHLLHSLHFLRPPHHGRKAFH